VVPGVSRENDGAEVLSYAVFLDGRQHVHMVEPDDLESA
jgi:hypothetical protein